MIDNKPAPLALSETELEILHLVATGATNREVARERSISEATVKKHMTNINQKLGTGNRTEAVRRALELGLVSVETPADKAEPAEDGKDGARKADLDVTRRLAEELERSRRRSRRLGRSLVVAALVLLAVALALVYAVASDTVISQNPTPPPPAPTTAWEPIWLPGARLPTERSGLALVAVGGTVYAIGGEDASGVLSDTLRYEQGLVVQWQREPPKPTAVTGIAAVVVEDRIVVPGGCTADGRATDVVELYDPVARRWSTAAPLPKPVCGYGLVALEGRVYLFGGRAGDDVATASNEVWTFRPGDAAWQPVAPEDRMPQPRADLAATTIEKDVHLLGGRDRSGQLWPDHWIYRPFGSSKWDTSGGTALPEGRAGLAAAGIVRPGIPQAQRWIYVIGGGWDANAEPGALLLQVGAGDGWQPSVDLGGPVAGTTPERGASLTVRFAGGQFVLAGGQTADGRRLKTTHLLNVNQPNFLVPGGP